MQEIFQVSLEQLSATSGVPLPKSKLVIRRGATLSNPQPHSLVFISKPTPENLELAKNVVDSLVLVPEGMDQALSLPGSNVVFPCKNPRLMYATLMSAALATLPPFKEDYEHVNGAAVAKTAVLQEGVEVKSGVFIDHDVFIERGAKLLPGASIRAYSRIGQDTVIGENSIIGSAGFGFERDESGRPIRLPHLGGVVIGRNVEIGSLTAICAGTIDPTIVEDDAKIDNLVHLAHNCKVGRGTLITACAEISGSVTIGQNAWIGPNASILQGLRIGHNSTVGLGAVVIKSVPDGETVAGNPARPTCEIAARNNAIERVISWSEGCVEQGRGGQQK